MNRKPMTIIAALVAPALCSAHELWIAPQDFTAPSARATRIELQLGERFLGAAIPRDETIIERFESIGPAGAIAVAGRSGANTHFARFGGAGVHVVSYLSKPLRHDMAAADFERYLRTEGLPAIAERRAALGETDRPGREEYTRCAKALVAVDGVIDAGFGREVGLPLEIVPVDNPLIANDGLRVRVLFGGKPLADATVVAVYKDRPTDFEVVHTDAHGTARVKLARPGACMITTIHMVRAPADSVVDWRSYWGSLTFRVMR